MNGPETGDELVTAELCEEELRRLLGLRVLYVEDEPDIADGSRIMLSTLGAEVTLCRNFESAASRIRAGGFDVLLSDLNLGTGRSALDLIRLLHRTTEGHAVPAIVLSAYGRAEDVQLSLQAGFALHLVKPADAFQVARALLAVVRAPSPT